MNRTLLTRAARRRAACLASAGLALLAGAPAATAESPEAEAIMERVDAQRGPDTARSRMTMRIYHRRDAERHDRELRLLTYTRGMDATHIEFASPRSIAGLRVLDLDGAVRVFFPSTGRVRNIGGAGRRGSVGGVGGDFSYEDMGGSGFTSDYHRFEFVIQNEDRWVIAGEPRSSDSQYSRLVFHIDRATYVPVRIDYYENDAPAKRLEADRIREIGGRHVATHLVMVNIAGDSRTEIRMHEVEWDVPLDDDLFHPNRFHR